jgi:hypothetical protein
MFVRHRAGDQPGVDRAPQPPRHRRSRPPRPARLSAHELEHRVRTDSVPRIGDAGCTSTITVPDGLGNNPAVSVIVP